MRAVGVLVTVLSLLCRSCCGSRGGAIVGDSNDDSITDCDKEEELV